NRDDSLGLVKTIVGNGSRAVTLLLARRNLFQADRLILDMLAALESRQELANEFRSRMPTQLWGQNSGARTPSMAHAHLAANESIGVLPGDGLSFRSAL